MKSSFRNHVQTLDTIDAMMKQESTYYRCTDYCQAHKEATNCSTLRQDRRLMLQWSYNILDFFHLERETAAIAMSYSDRFLQHETLGREYLEDTTKYQLLCIVALYVAIKLHEPASLTPEAFCEISRGQYSVKELETMERQLLSTLDWRVNPPTILAFYRQFVQLFPSWELHGDVRDTMEVLVRAQAERAIGDYDLIPTDASKVAYICIQNAMEVMGLVDCTVLNPIAIRMKTEPSQLSLHGLRRQLYSAVGGGSVPGIKYTIAGTSPMGTKCFPTTGSNKDQESIPQKLQTETTPRSIMCLSSARQPEEIAR